jgi:hypothetical protein
MNGMKVDWLNGIMEEKLLILSDEISGKLYGGSAKQAPKLTTIDRNLPVLGAP